MKDFTDEKGNVFVKLYKPKGTIFQYWETWKTGDYQAIIHWGKLGKRGTDIEMTAPSLKKFRTEINRRINKKIKEGYREIPIEKQYTVAITFKLDNWGSSKDLNRREKLRSIITEELGWTGNGRCDDGEIGSGEMRLFADVIDPYIAVKSILEEFEIMYIPEKPEFTIMYGGEVIERNYEVK